MKKFHDNTNKKCSMCGRILPHSWFNAAKDSQDGKQSYCKDCQTAYRKMHPFKEHKYNRNGSGQLKLF